MKRALITGITGQDGSFLAELLLEKGYRVFGLARRESWYRPNCATHLTGRIEVLFGDMSEGVDIASAIQEAKPDEIYNLAAQSRPDESWARAPEMLLINGLGAIRLFEAVRHNCPACRVYQASSSEMFGQISIVPQNEQTPFNPVNPYAAAKVYAHQMVGIYRKSYGLYIAAGILFNHESPRRGMNFITQKVTYGAACIKLGISDSPALNEGGEPIVKDGRLSMGNLDAERDWGYAEDYVEAMWLMLQQDGPDDFVIGTGKSRTIRELCETAFGYVGLDWQEHVIVDKRFVRLTETGYTIADASKAERILGWKAKTTFQKLVEMMVDSHIEILEGHKSFKKSTRTKYR